MIESQAGCPALGAGTFVSPSGLSARGSDSSPDSDAPAAAGRASCDLVGRIHHQGDQLCLANGKAVGSRFRSMSEPPTPAEMTAAHENLLKESHQFHGDLLALGAPQGQAKALVDPRGQAAGDRRRRREGPGGVLRQRLRPIAQPAIDTLVHDVGLTECCHDG